ncbi:MAG: hypothetical protein QFX37_00470 [Archaeoglobales archaeon]|nr:hypothetical protein [Archaeoglobales archaeon]
MKTPTENISTAINTRTQKEKSKIEVALTSDAFTDEEVAAGENTRKIAEMKKMKIRRI